MSREIVFLRVGKFESGLNEVRGLFGSRVMGQKCVALEHLAQGTSGGWANEFPVLAGESASEVMVLIGQDLLGASAVAVKIALLGVRVHGGTGAMIVG